MKHFYLLALSAGVAFSASAQRMAAPAFQSANAPSIKVASQAKATGDTLFLFDGSYLISADPQDQADFVFEMVDLDMLTPDAALSSYTSGWDGWYSTDPEFFLPGTNPDTNNFVSVVSWFSPPGTADNWFTFGPTTIPAAGAELSWYHMIPDASFSDGYQVFISTTGEQPYVDIDPDVDVPVFTKADCNNCVNDTDFVRKAVDISSYAGQRVYVHFRHNAADQFILYLDEVAIIEGTSSVEEKTATLGMEAFPNPAASVVNFNIKSAVAGTANIRVQDITGKTVDMLSLSSLNKGTSNFRYNTDKLTNGMYFFTLTNGADATTIKVSVVK